MQRGLLRGGRRWHGGRMGDGPAGDKRWPGAGPERRSRRGIQRKAAVPRPVAELVARTVEHWRRLQPRWTVLDWRPEANLLPPVATGTGLEEKLLARLRQIEAENRRQQRSGQAVLRAWVGNRWVRLELRGDPLVFRWCWRRRPQWGGMPRSGRRGRVILPAAPDSGWRSRKWPQPWEAMCVLAASAGIVEQARALLASMPFAGVWTTASPRRARHWLAHHPQCPLLLVEAGTKLGTGEDANGGGWRELLRLNSPPGEAAWRRREQSGRPLSAIAGQPPGVQREPSQRRAAVPPAEPGERLWVIRPGAWPGTRAEAIKIPVNAQELLAAARKICASGPSIVP